MKRIRMILLICLSCILCACGKEEEPAWTIGEEPEKLWIVSDTTRLSDDIFGKYLACGQEALFYLSQGSFGFAFHVLPYEDTESGIHTGLADPCQEDTGEYHLSGVYPGDPEAGGLLALWETAGRYVLVSYDGQGNAGESVDLNALGLQGYIPRLQDLLVSQGCYYFLTDKELITVTAQGGIVKEEWEDGRYQIFLWGETVILVEYADEKTLLHPIEDGEAARGGSEIPLSGDMLFCGNDGSIYLSSGERLFRCDLEKECVEPILMWNDAGVPPNAIRSVIEAGEDKFLVLGWENGAYEIWTVEPTDRIDQRTVITLLTPDVDDWWIQDQVRAFNEDNEEYRVVLEDPSEGLSYEGESWQEDQQTRIQLSLTSADPPDLVDIRFVDRWMEYAGQGVFEDLSSYLDSSAMIAREDYLPNILAGGQVDGRQIVIPYDFDFLMFYGREKYLGDNMGWTLQEMLELDKRYDGKGLIDGDPLLYLHWFLPLSLEEFIDFEESKCDFETPLFYDLLQCAADSQYTEEGFYGGMEEALRRDDSLLTPTSIVCFEFYLAYTGSVPGEDEGLALKGCPAKDGQPRGYANLGNACYAIHSHSDNKEGAWQFIEYVQTQKDDFRMGFPARRDWLMECVNREPADIFHSRDLQVREHTQEDIENLLYLIENLQFEESRDEIILQIIEEEAQTFFSGQKSAQEAAGIIQDRVLLYLSE